MTRPRSQTTRVLDALRYRGGRGITAADFALPDVIDGGQPIMRLAARVHELRSQGYRINDGGRKGPLEIYVLAADTPSNGPAAPDLGPVPPPLDPSPRLFDPPPPVGRSAYDEAA